MSAAVTLLPMDQLSSGVCAAMYPLHTVRTTMWPRQYTTTAAVIPAGEAKAASKA